MTDYDSGGLETPTDRSIDPLDVLDFSAKTGKRATHEALDLTPCDGHVEVRNDSHADADAHTYDVDVVSGLPARCSCPAWEYHDGACKHMVAVALAEPILEAADPGSDPLVRADGGVIDAGDDGEILDDASEEVVDLATEHGQKDWTRHTEPAEQGGADFWRCEGCQREILGSIGREHLEHADGCPVGEGR